MVKSAGSQARAIGAEIRKHRNSLEWSLEKLSVATDISRATLSRIETGARRPSIDEVASILTALGVTGGDKERLVRLASDGSYIWVGIGEGVSQQLSAISTYETEAIDIVELQISVIPGLLQTPEYSRTLISASPLGSAERERAVFTRVGRQSVLTRPGLNGYRAFIDEAAFLRRVGNASVMLAQFEHVRQVSRGDRSTVRILPFSGGADWGYEGAFILYDFPSNDAVVYQENQGTGVFIEENSSVKIYEQVIDNLDNVDLDPSESEDLISQYIERYRDGFRFSQE